MYPTRGISPNIMAKTLGSVMNTSPGPASGAMPTLNTVGKMMNPLRIATAVSMMQTLVADLTRRVSRLKYDE